ncbi:glycosyltransferase family 2 protein [Pyrobaculum aerophilum]|uniref:glycosyltransferase family 2 protein n=1 Tax=Pyrobaculum aerophilum TaxID=13773 RepID=UPI000B0BD7F7|nr:glycosyltransferase family 2 protein [Pyrobaculum aerophilum]
MGDLSPVCITVVLPTLNEAQALPKVVEELRATGYRDILVVDGGSTDGTVEEAKRLGLRVIGQYGRGKGMALRTALMYVETPYVAVLDADYTYPPAELNKLVPLLRHYDVVIGARQGKMPALYKLGNKVLAWLFRVLFGVDLRDPLTGMYVARTDVLREAVTEARGFDLEVEILAKALANGARVAEVPIQYRERIGKKKLRPWHGVGIAVKALELAYRLNPALFLTLIGALMLIPAVALGGWVAYRYFYQGVPHYMLGLAALLMLVIGGISTALLPLHTTIQQLRASIRRALIPPAPTDCLSPLPQPPPPAPPQRPAPEKATVLERAAQGLITAFIVLLAAAAYYLGIGDAATANKLAEWAYYALAGGVLATLIDTAIAQRRQKQLQRQAFRTSHSAVITS